MRLALILSTLALTGCNMPSEKEAEEARRAEGLPVAGNGLLRVIRYPKEGEAGIESFRAFPVIDPETGCEYLVTQTRGHASGESMTIRFDRNGHVMCPNTPRSGPFEISR